MTQPKICISGTVANDYLGHALALYHNQPPGRRVYIIDDKVSIVIERGLAERIFIVAAGKSGIGVHPRMGSLRNTVLYGGDAETIIFSGRVVENAGVRDDGDGNRTEVPGLYVSFPTYPPGGGALHAVLPTSIADIPNWYDITDDIYLGEDQGYGSLHVVDTDFDAPIFYSWHGPIGGVIDTVSDHTADYDGNYHAIYEEHKTPFRYAIYSGGEVVAQGFVCGWNNNPRALVVGVSGVVNGIISAVLCVGLLGSDGYTYYRGTLKDGTVRGLIATSWPAAADFGVSPSELTGVGDYLKFGGAGYLYINATCAAGNTEGDLDGSSGWVLGTSAFGSIPRQVVTDASRAQYAGPKLAESKLAVANSEATLNPWYDTDYQITAEGAGWIGEGLAVLGVSGSLVTTSKTKTESTTVSVPLTYQNFCVPEELRLVYTPIESNSLYVKYAIGFDRTFPVCDVSMRLEPASQNCLSLETDPDNDQTYYLYLAANCCNTEGNALVLAKITAPGGLIAYGCVEVPNKSASPYITTTGYSVPSAGEKVVTDCDCGDPRQNWWGSDCYYKCAWQCGNAYCDIQDCRSAPPRLPGIRSYSCSSVNYDTTYPSQPPLDPGYQMITWPAWIGSFPCGQPCCKASIEWRCS